jgi:hypothetical protein
MKCLKTDIHHKKMSSDDLTKYCHYKSGPSLVEECSNPRNPFSFEYASLMPSVRSAYLIYIQYKRTNPHNTYTT